MKRVFTFDAGRKEAHTQRKQTLLKMFNNNIVINVLYVIYFIIIFLTIIHFCYLNVIYIYVKAILQLCYLYVIYIYVKANLQLLFYVLQFYTFVFYINVKTNFNNC